jgi:hypothetical protein
MPSGSRPLGERIAMGIIAGLVAFGLAFATRTRGTARVPVRAPNSLESRGATFELHPAAARLTVRSRDGALDRELDLALVVDGDTRPLALDRDELRATADGLRASVPIAVADATLEATLEIHVDAARDALLLDLTADPGAPVAGHGIALRAELSSEGQTVFVPGVGPIADRVTVNGGALLVDADPHPLGLLRPPVPSSSRPCSRNSFRRASRCASPPPRRRVPPPTQSSPPSTWWWALQAPSCGARSRTWPVSPPRRCTATSPAPPTAR